MSIKMTNEEKLMAKALAKCTFIPGVQVKRFARDMAFRAELDDADPLTPRQAEYLRNAVIRFRRQIDPKIVDLADLKNRKTT
jgi:hypothetical protein